jgi:hypothetical protein
LFKINNSGKVIVESSSVQQQQQAFAQDVLIPMLLVEEAKHSTQEKDVARISFQLLFF